MNFKHFKISILGLLLICLLPACDIKDRQSSSSSPKYNSSVSAFTSGLVSNQSGIQIRLSDDFKGEIQKDVALDNSIIEISPKVEGQSFWLDNRTIEFRPSEPLPSGTEFNVRLRLSRLLGKNEKDFQFGFTTIPLKLSVDMGGISTYSNKDLKWNSIVGKVTVSDVVNIDDLEQIVIAEQGGVNLDISWDHESDKVHVFSIDSVERKATGDIVNIYWDGKTCGLDIKGSREYEIPALGDFIFMDQAIIQQPEQYISLRFSDPLKSSQYLPGLIRLDNDCDLRFSIKDNEVKIYPAVRQYGSIDLIIEPGIQNILGYKNSDNHRLSLNFEELKPNVRLIGNGVIIPQSEKLLFPFEAVNLKAVDVRIIKIFEDNVAQFLQVNSLSGSSQLKRAGRLIYQNSVDLIPERPIHFGEWNAFSLDLSELIQTEPGAIYRVELSFRKKHSLYNCPDSESDELEESKDEFDGLSENDIAYWDSPGGYYNYYRGNYNWRDRDNPCTDSYYNYYKRNVSRNILASNLGIIAKKGQDKSMLFAVSDLRTTEPLSGVKLEIYNYQQQLLAELTTNNEGVAEIKLENNPYLLVARKDEQRGYMTLENNFALSLSQFDVGGAYTRKGIKGYIYGERGVWRPGDSIFVNFILEDKENNLPENHPVIFELRDPLGKVRKRTTLTRGVGSFYSFYTNTKADDPTGNWQLRVDVGGVQFYKNLRIETVKPNRLKIKLDFGSEQLYSNSRKLKAQLSLRWLHGAIARNLKARIEVKFKNRETHFKGFEDYIFSDRTKSFKGRDKVIFDSNVDNEGMAEINADFNTGRRSRGMLTAVFTTRAFEEGGNFSINQFSIPYSPYSVYSGIKKPVGDRYGMLVTDSLYSFDIATVDEFGKPVSRKDVEVSVMKLNWRWWWHSSDENLASYTGNPEKYRVFSNNISTDENGQGSFSFQVKYPEWGRYLVYVKDLVGGHSATTIVYFDWPGYRGRSNRDDPQSASILPFSSDKTKYNVGETATVTIPGSGEGRIFLSIENGTRVFDHYWIKPGGEETSFSFTVTPDMTPNIYVNVSMLQPHAQTANDLPVRMYGVIPILVEDPDTRLMPEIKMPLVLEPESTVNIEVSEKNGKAMNYTLAIVDEGLLDLTGFRTPDPWHTFYAREALGVTTYDMYNFVLGAYGGRIDGVFSIGGDGEAGSGEPKKNANRFPPMVKFIGPFQLDAGKTDIHKIKIPNYVGSVRTMVVAGKSGAYGNIEKTNPVRKALMVLSTLPRILGPGEEFSLPVTVFAMEDHIKKAKVKLEAGELFEVELAEKTVNFETPGDKTLTFNLKVREKTGISRIKVMVSSGKEKAWHETEIEIRSPNPEISRFEYAHIEPGESWEKQLSLPGMAGTNEAILEVFSIPPFDFGRRLKSLLAYPHGCLEQISSAAFPQLYMNDIMDADKTILERNEKNVKLAIQKLRSFQLSSGGFAYWPSSTMENNWGSCYCGHFLLEAREKGYSVPEDMLKNWVKYQKRATRKWSNSAYESVWHKRSLEMTQAYRLYTLALAGEPEMGAMNRFREMDGTSNMAQWFLIGAYAHAGQKEIASELLNKVSYSWDSYSTAKLYTFGSSLRDRAIGLEILSLLGEKEKAIPLVDYISGRLSSGEWYSTQTTAYCLMAMSKYLGEGNTSGELSYDYAWNDEKSVHAASRHPVSSVERKFGEDTSARISIRNEGESSLFCRVNMTGIPLAGNEQQFSDNLGLEVHYQTLNGKSLDVSRLEQGTDFIAIVKVKNPGTLGYYKDLALTQIFPSGWEIQNQRMFETNLGKYNIASYEDIRDDRIYRYLDLGSREVKNFAVKLTASYEGRFYLPGVACEAMYRNDISAMVPGKWVEVIKPGE